MKIAYSLCFLISVQFYSFASGAQAMVDCSQLTQRTESFNGINYKKYNVVDSAFMKCPQVSENKMPMRWNVKKAEWTAQDELNFSQFIKKIGYSKCNTTDKCLSGSDNSLRTEEDLLFTHYSDCADFPYYLRSYFSYKNNLPFKMVTTIKAVPFSEAQLLQIQTAKDKLMIEKGSEAVAQYELRQNDLRYSRNGNYPVQQISIPTVDGYQYDFSTFGPWIIDRISSGNFRMANGQRTGVESDFYSPAVQFNSIKAGTVLYSISGHVAIVYDVTSKGEVLFVDAHPDNSVSRGMFKVTKESFQLSGSHLGGNFKNFRPVKVLNAEYDSVGNIIKGLVKSAADEYLTDFSLIQYTGNAEKNAPVAFRISNQDSRSVDFNDWVKFNLSKGTYKLDPVQEFKNEMDQLCTMTEDRIGAIQASLDNNIHLKGHPDQLPQNIFGADGEWEAYSSPGRDLRLRLKILSIPETAKELMKRYKNNDPLVSYKGVNLKQDFIKIYQQSVKDCRITFYNSQRQAVTINLETLISRVDQISYDPYSCPEIRWGAKNSEDLKTCTDVVSKTEWHKLQQFLRNNLVKDNSTVHGYTLDQLKRMNDTKEVNNSSSPERYKISSKLEAL